MTTFILISIQGGTVASSITIMIGSIHGIIATCIANIRGITIIAKRSPVTLSSKGGFIADDMTVRVNVISDDFF